MLPLREGGRVDGDGILRWDRLPGVPRVTLSRHKPTQYARTWDPEMPFDVGLDDLDNAVEAAVAAAARTEVVARSEELSRLADCYTSCHPNAGLPNALGLHDERYLVSLQIREVPATGRHRASSARAVLNGDDTSRTIGLVPFQSVRATMRSHRSGDAP